MHRTTLKTGLRNLLAHTLLFCGIGLILTLAGTRGELGNNLLISNAIGFCCWGGYELLHRLRPQQSRAVSSLLALPFGIVLGMKLAGWLGAPDLLDMLLTQPTHRWPILLLTLILSLAISGFLVFAHRAAADRANLAISQQQATAARQGEIAAQLAMLQAQIEPHFLFNTLANVQSLIDQDGATAKLMLEHLNQYLRATLARTRQPQGTLGDELAVIRHLLFIAGIRLGARLQWQIEVEPALCTHPLPPLLLQPLVENALKHGIEPALQGGTLLISARRQDDSLVLTVSDNGVGMQAAGQGSGVGLANVRQRLDSLYAADGRLLLQANPQGGVRAELILPWQDPPETGQRDGDSPINQA